jgi:hypothetical protein
MRDRVKVSRKRKNTAEMPTVQNVLLQCNSTMQEQYAEEVSPIVHQVLSSNGQPLDAETVAFFEPRFGHDFSQVRIHTDERSAESAQTVNALAYTVGQDVVFAQGQYMPETTEGKRLLAHELTHTLQQERQQTEIAPMAEALDVNEPGDA